MPKLGTPHQDDNEFTLVSLSGGELIYKGPQGRVMTEAEVKVRATTKHADQPKRKRTKKAEEPVGVTEASDDAENDSGDE